MALVADQGNVSSGQREFGRSVVVEFRARPLGRSVAYGAIGGHSGGAVVRACSRLVVCDVARNAR